MYRDSSGKGTTPDNYYISGPWFLGFVSSCFVIFFISLVAIRNIFGDSFSQMAVYLLFFSSVPIFTFCSVYRGMTSGNPSGAASANDRFVQYLGYYLPLAVLLYGLFGIDRALYHATYMTMDPTGLGYSWKRFVYGSSATALLIALAVILRSRVQFHGHSFISTNVSAFARFAFLGIFIVSLFNIDIGHDSESYAPYVGPASAVALGAVPLVDVFSVYGLSYLVLAACLKFMPWSMYSLSLVITILNLVYYLVVALICIRMSKDKTLATILSAFLILFLVSAALYNSAYTPSAGAMRYLPSLILLLTLCYLKDRSAFSYPFALSLCLSSLWSLEALIFSAVTYSAYIFAVSLRPRPIDFMMIARGHFILYLIVLMPHAVLTAAYMVTFGVLPRYDIYLQLVATLTTASDWVAPADPVIRTWVIFGFSYAIALAYALFRSWLPGESPGHHHNQYAVIASTAALGIMQFSYYAGRGVTPVLVFLAFPLLIIFVLFVDSFIQSITRKGKRLNPHYWPTAGLIVCMLVACGGVIADRFFRAPYVLRSNATLLRSCLSKQTNGTHCWVGLAHSVRDKLKQPAGFVLPDASGVTAKEPGLWQLVPNRMTEENISAYLLIKKWLGDQEKIFLFIPDSATVLFSLKKRNALGLSNPRVDVRSSFLREMAMRAAGKTADGTIIVVGDMSQLPLEREVYSYLQQRWTLQQIDGLGGVVVYRLQSRT